MKARQRLALVVVLAAAGVLLAACGSIPPGVSVKLAPDGQSAQVVFTGRVDAIGPAVWTIGGYSLAVDAATVIDGSIAAGDPVRVVATVTRAGAATADSISLASGPVPSDLRSMQGMDFFHELQETATPATTGTVVSSGTPEPTSQGTPMPKKVGELELTGTVSSIGSGEWVVAGLTFLIDSRTHIDGTIAVGDSVRVHAVVDPDGSYTATSIGPAGGNATATPAVSGHLEFTGAVQAIASGEWTVGGIVLLVTDRTHINGSPAVGDTVKVEAFVNGDGSLTAQVIQPLKDFGPFRFTPPAKTPGPFPWGGDNDNDKDDGGSQGTPLPLPHIQFPPFWPRLGNGAHHQGNH